MRACPFCASMDLYICDLDFEQGYSVLCLKCQGSGPQGTSPEHAFELWEQDPSEDILRIRPLKKDIQ